MRSAMKRIDEMTAVAEAKMLRSSRRACRWRKRSWAWMSRGWTRTRSSSRSARVTRSRTDRTTDWDSSTKLRAICAG